MDIEILHLVSVVKQRVFASQTDMSAVCDSDQVVLNVLVQKMHGVDFDF